jgi:hypothetical protein
LQALLQGSLPASETGFDGAAPMPADALDRLLELVMNAGAASWAQVLKDRSREFLILNSNSRLLQSVGFLSDNSEPPAVGANDSFAPTVSV